MYQGADGLVEDVNDEDCGEEEDEFDEGAESGGGVEDHFACLLVGC